MLEYDIGTFKNIFRGLDRAYGQYRVGEQKENGKQSGKAYITKGQITDQM